MGAFTLRGRAQCIFAKEKRPTPALPKKGGGRGVGCWMMGGGGYYFTPVVNLKHITGNIKTK